MMKLLVLLLGLAGLVFGQVSSCSGGSATAAINPSIHARWGSQVSYIPQHANARTHHQDPQQPGGPRDIPRRGSGANDIGVAMAPEGEKQVMDGRLVEWIGCVGVWWASRPV